jgi:hypothetical protein
VRDGVASRMRRLVLALAFSAVLGLVSAGAAFGADTLVTNGSPTNPFSQNKQNEPTIAVDPTNPQHVVAGANEEIDMEACAAGDPTTCPFTPGIGVSGVYFSFDGAASWTEPTYSGWTARHCLGPAECVAHQGPIGTLPHYFENGLVSDGDPALAFGPKPGASGGFSYANGVRLYYGNLTSNFSAQRSEQAFKGFEAIAVSHTDDMNGAAAGQNAAWSNPVIVSRQNAALFSDKDGIWADDVSGSPFFGNLYVCNVAFRGQEKSPNAAPEPVMFARSTDGGATFSNQKQLSPATSNRQTGGRQGCAVRTDSQGRVYVFWSGTDIHTRGQAILLATSDDGGKNFTRPRVIAPVTPVGIFDPVQGDITFDGSAGSRTNSFPSVDIANGAPDGSGATNEIVVTWSNGPTPSDTNPGPNEQAKIVYSTDRGATFTDAGSGSPASDRPDFPAVAIGPDGKDVWITYTNFLQPWQSSNLTPPRLAQGVVRHATVSAGGAPGPFTDRNRGPTGDARASSANSLTSGFLGDYSYAAAARGVGFAVWNDVRAAADCPAIDHFRQDLVDGVAASAPDVEGKCKPAFGNSDIFGGAYTP